MIPAQLGALPGLGTGPLLIGGGVFALVFGAIIAYIIYTQLAGGDPWDAFADATAEIVADEDADAIAFIPYSDGPLVPKPAIYDKELLGGKGGYRTPDGDRIYVDGEGSGKFSLQGVDVILAIDPTEHAAAVDPLKAWIWHQADKADAWIKIDREANLIEAAEGISRVADDVEPPAMDVPKAEGARAVADGGTAYASQVHETAHEEDLSLQQAKEQLEEAGVLRKIVDIAPPREAVIDETTGELDVEQASHVGVNVNEAADMLPKKTNTTEWQTMEEKARNEGMDPDKIRENLVYGFVIGAAAAGVVSVVMGVVLNVL